MTLTLSSAKGISGLAPHMLVLVLVCATCTLSSFSTGAHTGVQIETKPISKILIVKKGFISPDDPFLLAFARQRGIIHIGEEDKNPVCCIWIGPLSVDRKMTGEQFLMVHYGYTLIEVTSSKAIEMLGHTLQKKGFRDTNSLPVGILSSFGDAFQKAVNPDK